MRIAFLHQPWNRILPDSPSGSTPIWTWHASQRLQNQHEVYVYAHRHAGSPSYERKDNVQYVRVSAPLDRWIELVVRPLMQMRAADRPWMSSSLFHAQYYARVAHDMKTKGVEVVHVHSFPQAAAIIRFFHPSVKIVVHLHVEWLNLMPPRVARRQVRDVDLLVNCSEYLSEKMRRALPASSAKIKTIYNSVDVELFREKQYPPPVEARAWRILFVGRISPEKGIHILLEAFQRLIDDGENVYLDIIGQDFIAPIEVIVGLSDSDIVSKLKVFYDTTPTAKLRSWLRGKFPRRLRWLQDTTYRGLLQRMVKGEMASRVRFVGYVPNEDLAHWYREADLVVLPSLYETFGIPLIEAMASGTPVLASRTGGIPEIIEDTRTGLLVEPGNVEQLAKGMSRLLRDSALRRQMGQVGRKRVAEKFSWEKTAETLARYYLDLVELPHVTHPR